METVCVSSVSLCLCELLPWVFSLVIKSLYFFEVKLKILLIYLAHIHKKCR